MFTSAPVLAFGVELVVDISLLENDTPELFVVSELVVLAEDDVVFDVSLAEEDVSELVVVLCKLALADVGNVVLLTAE